MDPGLEPRPFSISALSDLEKVTGSRYEGFRYQFNHAGRDQGIMEGALWLHEH
jgi:hypothetical protein